MQVSAKSLCWSEFPGFDLQVNLACPVASVCWVMLCSKLSHCRKHDVSSHWGMKLERCALLGEPWINQTWFALRRLLCFYTCKVLQRKINWEKEQHYQVTRFILLDSVLYVSIWITGYPEQRTEVYTITTKNFSEASEIGFFWERHDS